VRRRSLSTLTRRADGCLYFRGRPRALLREWRSHSRPPAGRGRFTSRGRHSRDGNRNALSDKPDRGESAQPGAQAASAASILPACGLQLHAPVRPFPSGPRPHLPRLARWLHWWQGAGRRSRPTLAKPFWLMTHGVAPHLLQAGDGGTRRPSMVVGGGRSWRELRPPPSFLEGDARPRPRCRWATGRAATTGGCRARWPYLGTGVGQTTRRGTTCVAVETASATGSCPPLNPIQEESRRRSRWLAAECAAESTRGRFRCPLR
jgi:hypothetical protein